MIDQSAPVAAASLPGWVVHPRAAMQWLIVPIYCIALFCSSGLLFLAEPMFAKMVLPLLGGTPGVWNTCMVCFQALLLAGYAYAHWSIRYLGIRRQALVQLVLLTAVALALPIAIPSGRQPPVGQNPILWLLLILPVGVGLPFFAVGGIAPILQRWFATTGDRRCTDPYFLYAASNMGSMTALLAYPVLIEPLMRLADQSHLWSAGYIGLIALVGMCALFIGPEQKIRQAAVAEPIAPARRIRWILLAMVPSSLLLGTTTFITTDIAAVPLLWIIPLAIYLLSFILVFASRPLVSHRLMVRLQPVVVLAVVYFMLGHVAQPVWLILALHLAALFVCSMVCHGELAADRPSIGRLTDFYLTMSLGGVFGGLFNALVAPLIFQSAAEYPLALIAACALGYGIASARAGGCVTKTKTAGEGASTRILDIGVPVLVAIVAIWLPRGLVGLSHHDSTSLGMIGLGSAVLIAVSAIPRRVRFIGSLAALVFAAGFAPAHGELLAIRRSFFGIHRVVRNSDGTFNDLYHGTTVHGRQFVDAATGTPSHPTDALTYYHRTGPIGQLLVARTATGLPSRIGIVGMGVGSLSAYAGPKTQLTYYEIDPAVRWVAQDSGYFSFLKSAEDRGAKVAVVMGDARLTLRQCPSRTYDVLVIDAFSGDAIPMHLMTREAMSMYVDKLADGGILAIHISNVYLNLLPICSSLVVDAHCVGLFQGDLDISPKQIAAGKSASQWVIVARTKETLTTEQNDRRWQSLPPAPTGAVWTDDFSNILSAFRWR